MNTVYLTQAEPLLRGAHAATIKQEDRDKVRKIHAELLAFLRGYGIFYAEIPEDKTSKTSAPSKTVGDMSLASSIRRAADRQAKPIMDEDDARNLDDANKMAALEHNIACMVSDYEGGNVAGGRLRWAAIKADLRGQS